jgi:uncharacterized membrane protein YkgB
MKIVLIPPIRAHAILRVNIGIIYFWFGLLKFFPYYCEVEALAQETVHKLTFGIMNPAIEINLLAGWECLIGIFLIIGKWMRPVLIMLVAHMIGTFTPFLFFPSNIFRHPPFGLSLVGQYIIKNIVIISASLVLWQYEKEKSSPPILSDTAVELC